jgi:signal transduction histidine kinase
MNGEGIEAVRIVVADEGLGFDPAKVEALGPGTGTGLLSIRERLQWMSGRLEVESASGQGTRIAVSVPRRLPPSSPTPLDALTEGQLVGTKP